MSQLSIPRAGLGIGVLVLGAAAAAFGVMPVMLVSAYAVLSGVAWCLYWYDKSAAQRGARRTPESTLHLVDLLGGWPGALIAQQRFRHKTVKQPFQAVFWITVVLNLAVVGWLLGSDIFGR